MIDEVLGSRNLAALRLVVAAGVRHILLRHDLLGSDEVLLDDGHVDVGAQEHGLIRQHKAQLLVADGRAGAHEHWINQRLVFLRVNDAVLDDVADFAQYLLDLLRQHA